MRKKNDFYREISEHSKSCIRFQRNETTESRCEKNKIDKQSTQMRCDFVKKNNGIIWVI